MRKVLDRDGAVLEEWEKTTYKVMNEYVALTMVSDDARRRHRWNRHRGEWPAAFRLQAKPAPSTITLTFGLLATRRPT